MKKLLFLLLPLFSFGQVDSVNVRYIERINDYKELNIKNQDIEDAIKCTNDFVPEYSKLLQLDDLNNTEVQSAIIRDYSNRCKNYLNKGLYVFKSKELIEKYLKIQGDLLKLNTNNKIIDHWLEESKRSTASLNLYIQNNLKRLNIKQSDWDKMSDGDKRLLFKTFNNQK